MDKKGQVYIIAAILLSVVVFAVASVSNVARQEKFKGDFEKLSTNYEREGSKLINTVLNTGEDAGAIFGDFTYAFTAYSKTQNPQFGLIYALDYKGKVHVGNYLRDTIYLGYKGTGDKKTIIELPGCFENVTATISFEAFTQQFTQSLPLTQLAYCVKEIEEPTDQGKTIYVAIKNAWYPFKLTPGKPQLMIVSRMEQEEQRKVFVGGEGFVKVGSICKDIGKGECEEIQDKYGICVWNEDAGKCLPKEESAEGAVAGETEQQVTTPSPLGEVNPEVAELEKLIKDLQLKIDQINYELEHTTNTVYIKQLREQLKDYNKKLDEAKRKLEQLTG